MERPSPDLTGYREAQVALIAQLGTDIPFFLPAETVWPDVPLDPETGQPFDPTTAPLSSGFSSAVVRCGTAIRPIGLSRRGITDDNGYTAVGRFEDGEGVLIVPMADYLDATLDDATECEVYRERYEITQRDEDGIGDVDHRMIVHIRQR